VSQPPQQDGPAPAPLAPVGRLRHYGGFVMAGTLAFVTDVAVLALLTGPLGISPFLARLLSISVAMVVSWWINRTVSFQRRDGPSLKEFGRFAGVAWTANSFNYLVFSAILLVRPPTSETLAVAIASVAAMVLSYFGMRLAVFR
jgi:putative flippase GtrA